VTPFILTRLLLRLIEQEDMALAFGHILNASISRRIQSEISNGAKYCYYGEYAHSYAGHLSDGSDATVPQPPWPTARTTHSPLAW
jgi:hypothetical protein